eukprot:COSAG06_NODE_172_length_21346_cov_503.127053_11_plen_85_part_00
MACVQGFDRVQTLVYAKVGVFLCNTILESLSSECWPLVHEKVFKQFRFKEGDRVVFAEDDRHVGRVLADQSLVVRGQHSLLSDK